MKKPKPKKRSLSSAAAARLAGMRKHFRGREAIQDEFTDLPLSRERKRQLRKHAKGLCIIGQCQEPLATKNHCAEHALQISDYMKHRYHAGRKGSKRRARP